MPHLVPISPQCRTSCFWTGVSFISVSTEITELRARFVKDCYCRFCKHLQARTLPGKCRGGAGCHGTPTFLRYAAAIKLAVRYLECEPAARPRGIPSSRKESINARKLRLKPAASSQKQAWPV